MHLILTGATGMIGTGVLDIMLRTPEITKISILSRRPVQFAEDVKDPRVNVIKHSDFTKYDSSVLSQLADAKGCVWALGTSQTQVSKEDYVKITKDFAMEAAKAFSTLSKTSESPFRFVYVSGEGATHAPGFFTSLFGRVKGETEQELAALAESTPTLKVISTRPCAVDVERHERARDYAPDPVLAIKALRVTLMTPIRVAYQKMHSPTDMLGRVHAQLAMGKLDDKLDGYGAFPVGSKSWVLQNWGLQRLDADQGTGKVS